MFIRVVYYIYLGYLLIIHAYDRRLITFINIRELCVIKRKDMKNGTKRDE